MEVAILLRNQVANITGICTPSLKKFKSTAPLHILQQLKEIKKLY